MPTRHGISINLCPLKSVSQSVCLSVCLCYSMALVWTLAAVQMKQQKRSMQICIVDISEFNLHIIECQLNALASF